MVISEDDYRSIVETLNLLSVPGMKKKLLEEKNTVLPECVAESEVDRLKSL